MILHNFTDNNDQVELSDSWTEQDLQDLSAFALSNADDADQLET